MNISINNTMLQSAVAETANRGIMFYLKQFLSAPFIVGGITLFLITVFALVVKHFISKSEDTGQNFVWSIAIYSFVFFGMLLLMIFLDTADALIYSKMAFLH